jgi:2-oxoglutarate dehydrogenase E2 component (dihydrolipoamide succinyltransferase)
LAEVTLPSLGESVTEGIITQWFKKLGEVVARDEALFEVSTDKVDSEMPSPAAGVLVKILAQEGDTVETGAVVAIIDESADAASVVVDTPAAPTSAAPAVVAATTTAPTSSGPGILVSPVVRRILADGGVEPSTVKGTGPAGTITRRDAERAVANGPTEDVVVPMSNGRKRMGQHMVLSSATTPHGFVAVDIDATFSAKFDVLGRVTAQGSVISDELIVAHAAVAALAEFPLLNASFNGDDFVEHRTINLGVARPAGTDGMLVPVIHAASGLSVTHLADRVADLDARLTTRHLFADDLLGGTFTVYGAPSPHALYSAAIIIQPQVAALTVGAVRATPVVNDVHEVVAGLRVTLGLSFDHRICEPTMAAAFLERVGEIVAGLDGA